MSIGNALSNQKLHRLTSVAFERTVFVTVLRSIAEVLCEAQTNYDWLT